MDTLNIVILAAIVSAFSIFAVVLAYAERSTRNLHRERTLPVAQANARTADERKAA